MTSSSVELGSDDPPLQGSSGKSSSDGNGFLSRSSSISLSTSKSYSSKISINEAERTAESNPNILTARLRKNSKNSNNIPANSSPTAVSLPAGVSPSPPNSGPIKSMRAKFRRSISNPDDGSLTAGVHNSPSRAKSFDVAESTAEIPSDQATPEEKESSQNEQHFLSGSLRKGSLHAIEFFLSRAGSKASSWVSSHSNNEIRLDSSAKREKMKKEASTAQLKKYDAFADHSGLQQTQQMSTSESDLLSDADRLEIHFQDTYNHDNIGQFKRVLVLVALYQSCYCIAGLM